MPHIDAFLNFMLEHKASDMHLSSGCPVAYRIDGEMVFTNSDPFDSDYIEALVFEIMSERNQNQFRRCSCRKRRLQCHGCGSSRGRTSFFQW